MGQEIFIELVRRVSSRAPGIPSARVKEFLNERYRKVVDARSWSWLAKEGVLQTDDELSAGTADVASLSASVVGSGTSWASVASAAWLFRIGSDADYYFVQTVSSPTALTLDTLYEKTTTANAGYKINRARYTLASDMDKIIEMRIARATRPLQEVSLEWLDKTYPSRPYYGDPIYYAYTRSTGTTEEVELYPIPDRILTVRYLYKYRFTELANDTDTLLPDVPADVLIHGAMADAWRSLEKHEEAAISEALFRQGIAEMVASDAREGRPERLSLAPQYVSHRRRRSGSGLDDWRPWLENPY